MNPPEIPANDGKKEEGGVGTTLPPLSRDREGRVEARDPGFDCWTKRKGYVGASHQNGQAAAKILNGIKINA